MPCQASSLLPRQPCLFPDHSGHISAGSSHRATRSSCASQPLLRSGRTLHVPHSHSGRHRRPDTTPSSVPRLPVRGGAGVCSQPAHGTVRIHRPLTHCCPVLQKLPPASSRPSCPGCPQCCPGPADATMFQVQPLESLWRGWHRGGTTTLTTLLTPRCCQCPLCHSQCPLREVLAFCHLDRRTRLCLAPISPTRGSGESHSLDISCSSGIPGSFRGWWDSR